MDTPPATVSPEQMVCPVCRKYAAVSDIVCPHCGFPFSCDLTPVDSRALRRRTAGWRYILGITAVLFWLVSAVFTQSGYLTYQGFTTEVVTRLNPDHNSGIELEGPAQFIRRTELTLGLLKQRAPDFYWRMRDSVTTIEYLAPHYLETEEGRRISLEGIGALAEPATGRVLVVAQTVFPSGPADLYDRDVFSYAGVLVHELRHIELHAMGLAPGGWQEEVLCEQAAYNAVRQASAPGAILAHYEMYLANPQHARYQNWYRWYEQWE